MGSLVGHVVPGFGFLLIGLWHLFNTIKLHHLNPKPTTFPPWYPTSRVKYLELYLIMFGSSLSIAMELFIGPRAHQPFDPDGTIPSNHLHNFEHSTISLTFLTASATAILLDRTNSKARLPLTQLLAALAFAQQLLLFHLHSSDHMGVEGQYHLLLQIIVFVTLVTSLIAIPLPKSFVTGFVRSASVVFQGVWFIFMGYMLWTPELMPKGCFLNLEEGHDVVRCRSEEALHRAKSLVNMLFSWWLVVMMVFSVSAYVLLERVYGETQRSAASEYEPITKLGGEFELGEYSDDVESQRSETTGHSIQFDPIDTGR